MAFARDKKPDVQDNREHQKTNHQDPINEKRPEGSSIKNVSEKGIEYLRGKEKGPDGGPALKVYDATGNGDYTIGWGHKLTTDEIKNKTYEKGITADKAEELFKKDIKHHVAIVNELVHVPLNQDRFDALAIYAFNFPKLGPKLLEKLNKGDYVGAGEEINVTTGGGVPLKGLEIRRKEERDIYFKGVYAIEKVVQKSIQQQQIVHPLKKQ